MKLSAVYKSSRKVDTYLYVEKTNDFSKVPDVLLKQFGRPVFVMTVPLSKRNKVANLNTDDFIERLDRDGFYLQLPPKPKDLLAEHKTQGQQKG